LTQKEWDGSKWDKFYCHNGGWIFSNFESDIEDQNLVDSSNEYLRTTEPKNDSDIIESADFRCKANAEQYDKLINALDETVKVPWGVMRSKVYTPLGFDRTVRYFEKFIDNQDDGFFNLWPIFVYLYFNSIKGELGYRGDEEFYDQYLSPACYSLGLKSYFIKEKIVVPHRLRKEPLMLNSVGLCKPKYDFEWVQKTWSVYDFVSNPVYVEALGGEIAFEICMESLDCKREKNSIDSAISNFLKADKQLILEAEDYMWCYHHYMMDVTGTVFVKKKKDLWKEFYFPRTVRVEALEPGLLRRKSAYLELRSCSCSWEAHGLDLGFLNGSKLIKVGVTGDSLSEYLKSDSKVFGTSSECRLIEIVDSITEQDYPNYHFK